MKRIALLAMMMMAALISAGPAHADFHGLCAAGSAPSATVSMTGPLNYSGLLTYSGAVKCNGTTVNITDLTITPVLGWPPASSAGTASCSNCTDAISVSGTVEARILEYDVTMDFNVTRAGSPTVSEHRLGRFVASWGGSITTLCPIDGDETCPA